MKSLFGRMSLRTSTLLAAAAAGLCTVAATADPIEFGDVTLPVDLDSMVTSYTEIGATVFVLIAVLVLGFGLARRAVRAGKKAVGG